MLLEKLRQRRILDLEIQISQQRGIDFQRSLDRGMAFEKIVEPLEIAQLKMKMAGHPGERAMQQETLFSFQGVGKGRPIEREFFPFGKFLLKRQGVHLREILAQLIFERRIHPGVEKGIELAQLLAELWIRGCHLRRRAKRARAAPSSPLIRRPSAAGAEVPPLPSKSD